MAKLLTTISSDYVNDWGFYEGVRELIQNGLDAQDKGFRFDIVYLRDRQELIAYNEGTSITRSNLLLGNTSKRGDETQRGQYGEGFKVAILALIRAGYPVLISNGINGEVITSSIENHPDYGGTQVLCFHTEQTDILPIDKNKLIFKVSNVTPQDVSAVKDKFLQWNGLNLDDYYKSDLGKVLLPEQYKGKIFCKGIYVCNIEKLEYGYDFEYLQLGRDRNLASSVDISWKTAQIWSKLGATYGKDELVLKMLKSDAPDVEDLNYFTGHKLKSSIFEEFQQENGPKSYPCSSEYQKREIASLGYKPVVVSETHRRTLEGSLPSLSSIKEKQKLSTADSIDMTMVFSRLLSDGWKVKFYECDCGGKYAWLKPGSDSNFSVHGCVCHNTPLDILD